MKNVCLVLFVLFVAGCSMVGPGQRGVVTTFGKVDQEPLGEGLHLWIPFVHGVHRMDTQIQKQEVQTVAGSKDLQDVTMSVALNYSIDREQVAKIFQTIGDENDIYEKLITPAVSEVLKAATAKKTAEEILMKRQELKNEIDDTLKARLGKYGVIVADLSITHVEFSKDFSAAIEHKQVAEQRAKQAVYEAQKAEQDAQAEINRAKGQAEAQRVLQSTLTTAILQKLAIEKWNGVYPQTMVNSSGAVPLIRLPEAK